MGDLGNDLVLSPILVTGSTGYLGSHIVKKLTKEKIAVISVTRSSTKEDTKVCDLTSKSKVKKLLERTNPSRIIHCAAAVPKEVGGVVTGYKSISAAEESLAMALNISEVSTCPVVFISSMSVYDNGVFIENPVCEEAGIYESSTPYAASKYTAEKGMEKLTNSGLITLRLPGLFGKPRITGVLYKAAYAFLSGKEFKLTSTPLWAAMHVEDAADSCVRAAKIRDFPESDTINIGYSDIFNIISVIKLLADICSVEWNDGALSAPNFQANLEKSKKYSLCSGGHFKNRLEQLVRDVRSDVMNS